MPAFRAAAGQRVDDALHPHETRALDQNGDAGGRVARLYALGTLARTSAAAFGEGATHYADADGLAHDVARDARAGVTVLVKGSRFMRMERVVAALAGRAAAGAH